MILLIGATGAVGAALLPHLVDAGAVVRAMAHSPTSRGRLGALGVDVVDGDLDRPDTLSQAIEGCDQVFLLSPAHPGQADRERAAIDAAVRAGVGHIVALSVMGASRASTISFARGHAEIDDHLQAAGPAWTVLRPSGFMQAHLLPVGSVAAGGAWYGMTGDGASAYVDVDDVAAAAATVLTTSGHEGAVYELTGPASISMPEAAAALGEVLGRTVAYIDVPAAQFRTNLIGAGLPDWIADDLVALYRTIRAGHFATVSNAVEQVTGRPARGYRQVAQAHRDDFAST